MATFGEILSGLARNASEMAGNLKPGAIAGQANRAASASAKSRAQLAAFLEQARRAELDNAARQAAPGESVRQAVQQLADGSAYIPTGNPTQFRDPNAPIPLLSPPLRRQLADRSEALLVSQLERQILEGATPTANADGTFTPNVFAGYNLLDRASAQGSLSEVIDALAAKYDIVNDGDIRAYHQRIVNAVVGPDVRSRAQRLAQLQAEPNNLEGQVDDMGRVVSGSTLAGNLEGSPRATGVPGQSPSGLAEEPLPEISTLPAEQPGMPPAPMEQLVVGQRTPYVTERRVVVDPVTGKPVVDSYGFEVVSQNSPSAGATQEDRLRSEVYTPTNARRNPYRPIMGRTKFYASTVGPDGTATPDYSRELTVLQRGAGTADPDRIYLLQRPDGTYHAVDTADPNAGSLMSEAAVRDLLESQGYVHLTGPDIIGPRPGSTDPNFVEASGRRLFEALNGDGVPNPTLLRQTVDALHVLETSGGGERFAQAMAVAGLSDPDTAEKAMAIIRRQGKAKAAAEIRQRLASADMDAAEDPELIAGYLSQHPAFAGEPDDELLAYASMPGEELVSAAQVTPAQSALVDTFMRSFQDGYEKYNRVKAMLPDAPPPTDGSLSVSAGSTAGSGSIDLTHSVDPSAVRSGVSYATPANQQGDHFGKLPRSSEPIAPERSGDVDWGGVRARLARYGSSPPSQVAASGSPATVVDAASGAGAQVFDGPVPSAPMSSIMMDMAPAPADTNLGILDRLRGMFGGSPAGRMAMAPQGALAFEVTPGSWASRVQEPVLAAPQPFSIDTGVPQAGRAADEMSRLEAENTRAAKAMLVRRKIEQSGSQGIDATRDAFDAISARPEFAGLSEDEVMEYASLPMQDLEARRSESLAAWNRLRTSVQAGTQTASAPMAGSSVSSVSGGGRGEVSVVGQEPMSSRVASTDAIKDQATRAQSILRDASLKARELDNQKQLADDYAYSIDMMRMYIDQAANPESNLNPFTGRQRTMAPQARIMLFRPFTRLPQEMKAKILGASRGELEAMFAPAQANFESLKAQADSLAPQRREVRAGLDQAKDDYRFASDAERAQRDATTVIDVNGMAHEIGPSAASPRAAAEAEEASRAESAKFAQLNSTRSALGVQPSMSADARNAIVRDILSRDAIASLTKQLESETDPQKIARLQARLKRESSGSRSLPIAFRDFDTHAGGINEDAVRRVEELQAQLDEAVDQDEIDRLQSEIQDAVRKSFGPGMQEQPKRVRSRETGQTVYGTRVVDPSGVNQNRLLRRFITADSPNDRLDALREMFGERIPGSGIDVSDGLENLRKLASDGRLGGAEDIIYDTLIRRLEFAQAQRGAVDELGEGLEDDALLGFSPEALRMAASDAVRDMDLVKSGPARILPKESAGPAATAAPAGPVRRAIQAVVDAAAKAGGYITGLDATPPAATAAAGRQLDANKYLISTLPTREEIYAAQGAELDRLLANIETAKKNAADHAGVTGADMAEFTREAEARLGNLARRMQQPDANYTPPAVKEGPLGFRESSILQPAEPQPRTTAAAATKPSFRPVSVAEASRLEAPKGFSGTIEVPAEHAAQLNNWLAGRFDGSDEPEVEAFSRKIASLAETIHDMPEQRRISAILELRGVQPGSATDADMAEAQRLSDRLAGMRAHAGSGEASDPERLAKYEKAALASRQVELSRIAENEQRRLADLAPKGRAKPSGPAQISVEHGKDADGRASSTIVIKQSYLAPQSDGTMKEVTVSKRVSGRRLDAITSADGGVRLGEPASGLAAIDFDESGTPIQVRRASVVPTRDLRGTDQSFEEVPIIGQTQRASASSEDDFYDNAGVNRTERYPYEGTPFEEDAPNLHEQSVQAATEKPSARTSGVVEAPTGRSADDLAALQRQVDRDLELKEKAEKVRKAKVRTRTAAGAIALPVALYAMNGGDGQSAAADDFGLFGSPEEDTNLSSEPAGNQVRLARRRLPTLMTPARPTYW